MSLPEVDVEALFDTVSETIAEEAPGIAISIGSALLVLFVSYTAARWLSKAVSRFVERRNARAASMSGILRALTFAAVMGLGVISAFSQIGVDVTTLLAGAGVAGLAVGFGAQAMVKDLISGFFLILDGVIETGDIVEIDDNVVGQVEEVALRVTRVRSYDGRLVYIPNGLIGRVANWNRGWARAIVEVGLSYDQDLSRGLEVLQRIGDQWVKDNPSLALEEAEAQGALGLNGSDVSARLVVKIDNNDAHNQPRAERELRALVKAGLEDAGIDIPFPTRVLVHRNEEALSGAD